MTKYEKSLAATVKLRDDVAADLHPLFDHLIELAKHSHKNGYPKRAGRELRHARKLTTLRRK